MLALPAGDEWPMPSRDGQHAGHALKEAGGDARPRCARARRGARLSAAVCGGNCARDPAGPARSPEISGRTVALQVMASSMRFAKTDSIMTYCVGVLLDQGRWCLPATRGRTLASMESTAQANLTVAPPF